MFKKFLIIAAMAIMSAAAATQADAAATFALKISATGAATQNLTTSCGTTCLDGSPVTLSGSGGNKFTALIVEGQYGLISNGIGLTANAFNLTHTSATAGDMTILMTYTGLTGNQLVSLQNAELTVTGNSGVATVTSTVYISDTNGAYSETTQVATGTALSGGSNVFLTGTATSAAALYSVTIQLNVHFNVGTSGKSIIVSFQTDVVPEPATLALLGMGLLLAGLAFGWRRDRNDLTGRNDLAA